MEIKIKNQTEAQTAFNVQMLRTEIEELHDRIDAAERQGLEEQAIHLERMLSAKAGLLDEQRDILDRFDGMSARAAAEARWQHHAETHTLDLY